jgi:hypothetical protein
MERHACRRALAAIVVEGAGDIVVKPQLAIGEDGSAVAILADRAIVAVLWRKSL